MGEIPAADEDDAAAQLLRRLPDQLPEAVVIGERQTGQPDADQLIIGDELVYII